MGYLLAAALWALPLVPLFERYKPYCQDTNRLALVMTAGWPLVEALANLGRLMAFVKGE